MNVRALASATSSAVNVVPKAAPQVKYLKDYLPPVYEVSTVDLRFELDDPDTTVTAKLVMSQNKAFTGKQPIVLFGDKVHKLDTFTKKEIQRREIMATARSVRLTWYLLSIFGIA